MDIPLHFDWTADPKALHDAYKQTNFELLFHEKISMNVISTLSPQLATDLHNLTYDDDLVYNKLIAPLERIIFDPSQTDGAIREKISTLKQPSKVCRKVLTSGDVMYSCKDCGLDDTCVVCIDCFHKGPHRNHNYRMSNSDGGGCCDCGDHEAWRGNPSCSDHHASDPMSLKLSDFEDIELREEQFKRNMNAIQEKISLLPDGIASRYFCVCQASLHYARTILALDNFQELPTSLAMPDLNSGKNYFTVLFNDEVHTYDYVITTLIKIIKCTKMTASIIASCVSREGRSLILRDDYKPCKQIRDSISSIRDSGQGPLKVEVIHGSVLAHQEFAIRLIKWVKQMSLLCDAFRILTAYTLLGHDQEEITLLERVMRSNTSYWKRARIVWNDLFVASLLTDYSIKSQFARLVTRCYPSLVEDFINDDHDHSVSVLTMTTQLYTVPSLICMLIEEENAITVIAQKLTNVCKSTKRDNASMTFDNRNTFDVHGLKRCFYIIPDIRHLIGIEPTKWTPRLRANVIEGVTVIMDLLESMQNMDSVKRQTDQHLEYEQEWETGMTLQSRLISLISRLIIYCTLDETVLLETLRETQRRLFSRFSNFKTQSRELFGHEATCIHYDVSSSRVSVHLPLTRFAAALILELMMKRPPQEIPYDETLIILTKGTHGMRDIMEHSLRTQVMIAQHRSGMWRKNGYSLANQIRYFSGALMRKEMYDRDLLVLQECAATMCPDKFLIHLVNKFNLFEWITSETCRAASSSHNDDEIMTQTMSLGEEFLQLLLTITSERYRVGVGKVTSDDVVKNEIIQLLCIGPFTPSDIAQKLFYIEHEIDCIKYVADLRRSGELSSGRYELKSEYYDRFNPFFYHHNRQNQSNALDTQLKRKRAAKERLICCPPPKPAELTLQFANLNNLLICETTLTIIKKILSRASRPQAPNFFPSSDLQLDQCLHLIGLGLHEQERDLDFRYLTAAHSKQIWLLLKECYEKTKRSMDLILWLMKKGNTLLDRLRESGNQFEDISRCFDSVLEGKDLNEIDTKKRNSQLAAQSRQRIMAAMRASQEKFLSNVATKELADETAKHEESGSATTAPVHTCILCRDEQVIDFGKPTMLLLGLVQRSAVLSKNRNSRRIPNYSLTPSNHLKYQSFNQAAGCTPERYSYTSDNGWSFDATHMPADLFFGPYVSTCGHAMHYDCWRAYHDAVSKREFTRPNRGSRHASFDLEKNEILCPLCDCISNATIPLLPDYTRFARRDQAAATIFNSSPREVELSAERLAAFLHALKGTVTSYKHVRHLNTSTEQHPTSLNHEDKYMRLLQPTSINDVLGELGENEALILRDFIATIHRDRIQSSKCTRDLLSSIKALADRIHSVGLDLDGSINDVPHDRIFMMTTWSISYTIQTQERMLRSQGSPLFGNLESVKSLCLDSLIRFSCASMMTHQSDVIQSLLVRKLRYLLITEEHQMASPSVLDIDAFEMLVSIFVMLQKLYWQMSDSQSGQLNIEITPSSPNCAWTTGAYDHEYLRNLLHLMVVLNLVQVIITMQTDYLAVDDSESSEEPEVVTLHNFYGEIVVASGHPHRKLPVRDHELVSRIKSAMLPFLRSCAIFLYHLSHIPPRELSSVKDDLQVFEDICRYLDLPGSLCQLLGSRELRDLALSWSRHSRVQLLIKEALRENSSSSCENSDALQSESNSDLMPVRLIRQPHSVNRLVSLPNDYSDLVYKVSDFSCPSIRNEDSLTPTMCLVCGVMLCSQSYCCQRDLNNLASNYRQLTKRQDETHQQWLASGAELVESNTGGGYPQNSAAAAAASLHSGALAAISLLFPQGSREARVSAATSRGGGGGAGASSQTHSILQGHISQQLVGSCTYHAHECSGGVGIFLRVRSCEILLLSGRSKGCYMPAPYIDDHGQTDINLIRGKPLHLSDSHYRRLQQLWMNHAIPEQISRTLEYSSYASSINWHLH